MRESLAGHPFWTSLPAAAGQSQACDLLSDRRRCPNSRAPAPSGGAPAAQQDRRLWTGRRRDATIVGAARSGLFKNRIRRQIPAATRLRRLARMNRVSIRARRARRSYSPFPGTVCHRVAWAADVGIDRTGRSTWSSVPSVRSRERSGHRSRC
jgi:hypothetical protein